MSLPSSSIPWAFCGAILLGILVPRTPLLSEDAPCRVPATMTYIPGSAQKLEQLIGDYDQQCAAKTRNQTWSRFAIRGTDLGSSFEHEGKLYFLFGDTIGPGGGDCLATSDTTDPEAGLSLDFLRENDTQYLKIQPPGISMQGFEVPTGGISANGKVYLFCTTDHSRATRYGSQCAGAF